MTVRIRTLPGSIPHDHAIVVFPHAGGSPRSYASWCRKLPTGIGLYGVTYPGRDALVGEPEPAGLVELAADCAEALKPVVESSESVVVFGHSMGSYVAFEAVRCLQRSQLSVTALAASGSAAPHLATGGAWHRASDDELIGHMGNLDARNLEVFAAPELRELYLPTVRSDFRLVETYRADRCAQVSCPVHICYGESDPELTPSHAAAWAVHAHGHWSIRSFPGDHFYTSTHDAEVIAHLSEILGES